MRAVEQVLGHPRKLALALGALAATGFEPLRLWPLTLLALAMLIEMLALAESRRRAFVLGWLFGLGHFSVGLNWLATAFTYQSALPVWLGGCAVVGLAAVLAVFPGLVLRAGYK